MVRSVGEKPVSPALSSSTSFRSARIVLAFQPNTVRSARVSQLSAASPAAGPDRGTSAGRLYVVPGSFEWVGSESAIAIRGAARNVGIGDGKLREDQDLELFHGIGLVIRLVIVAGKMKKSMHREMRQMMRKGLMLGARFAFRRLVSDHDIAEQAWEFQARRAVPVPETTARWSPHPCSANPD